MVVLYIVSNLLGAFEHILNGYAAVAILCIIIIIIIIIIITISLYLNAEEE